jgi:carbamoyltransferase
VPVGAAYCFALQNGAPPGPPLEHAFHCGTAPRRAEIEQALSAGGDLGHRRIGAVGDPGGRDRIADFMAYVVANGGIVGLYQGPAETGPRALGHRSILANPCDPRTRENLNRLVKHRELVRPLAPMATREAALRWFQLSPGAADGDYNAYRYMVLTALARPEAHAVIPAVIHHDGTGRIQIVRQETDPLTFAYLEAMGRHVGVEISVNTSLNVASPIAQTPEQAVQALRRSKGMDGIFMVAEEGDVYLVWHAVHEPPKDAGRRLLGWLGEWSRSG